MPKLALLATKADLREEIDRLKAHVVARANCSPKVAPSGESSISLHRNLTANRIPSVRSRMRRR
jgi:hypothetical protein